MFAALMKLTIDPAQAPRVATAFTNVLLPQVRAAPGFVAGYWLEPAQGQGFGFVVFETAEQAAAAMPPSASWATPGVVIEGVEVRRVAVAAIA